MNLCAKLTLHIHTNKLPNSVTAKLGTGLPSQHLGWKSTAMPDRQLWSRVVHLTGPPC